MGRRRSRLWCQDQAHGRDVLRCGLQGGLWARRASQTLHNRHPQVIALRHTLDRLAADKQCAVFFYATEEKKQLAELMDPQRYQKLQGELKQIFTPYADRGITFIPPLDSLKSEFYLDYGHLDDAGNAIVARAILEGGISQSITRSTGTR